MPDTSMDLGLPGVSLTPVDHDPFNVNSYAPMEATTPVQSTLSPEFSDPITQQAYERANATTQPTVDPSQKWMQDTSLPLVSRLGGAIRTSLWDQMYGLASSAWGAATLPGDVATGKVDPNSPEALARSTNLAGFMGTGPTGGLEEGAFGTGWNPKAKAYLQGKWLDSFENYLFDQSKENDLKSSKLGSLMDSTPADVGYKLLDLFIADPEVAAHAKQALDLHSSENAPSSMTISEDPGPPPVSLAQKPFTSQNLDKINASQPDSFGNTVPDISNFNKVGPQMGSNDGGVYQDPESGQNWYVKKSPTDDHAKNENLANELYRQMGVPTLDTQLIKHNGQLGVASPMTDITPMDIKNPQDIQDIRQNFAPHALLSNWDAIGLGYDNQGRVNGQMTTIDSGGSLNYRAQGTPKGDAFGPVATEWNSLRDPKKLQSYSVFGGMSDQELKNSALKVANLPDQTIRETVMQHGPGNYQDKLDMADKLVARKQDIIQKAGLSPATSEPLPTIHPQANFPDLSGEMYDLLNPHSDTPWSSKAKYYLENEFADAHNDPDHPDLEAANGASSLLAAHTPKQAQNYVNSVGSDYVKQLYDHVTNLHNEELSKPTTTDPFGTLADALGVSAPKPQLDEEWSPNTNKFLSDEKVKYIGSDKYWQALDVMFAGPQGSQEFLSNPSHPYFNNSYVHDLIDKATDIHGQDNHIKLSPPPVGPPTPPSLAESMQGREQKFVGPTLPFNPSNLDLSPEARMQRAQSMGFNTEMPLYHGIGNQFDTSSRALPRNTSFGDPSRKTYERGIFSATDPEVANQYAGSSAHYPMSGAQVLPMYSRASNPKTIDWGKQEYSGIRMNQEINDAIAQGHDALHIKNIHDIGGLQEQYVTLNPNTLRSKFAVFDPKYKDSSNLLASKGIPLNEGEDYNRQKITPVDHDPFTTMTPVDHDPFTK